MRTACSSVIVHPSPQPPPPPPPPPPTPLSGWSRGFGTERPGDEPRQTQSTPQPRRPPRMRRVVLYLFCAAMVGEHGGHLKGGRTPHRRKTPSPPKENGLFLKGTRVRRVQAYHWAGRQQGGRKGWPPAQTGGMVLAQRTRRLRGDGVAEAQTLGCDIPLIPPETFGKVPCYGGAAGDWLVEALSTSYTQH